LNINKIPLDGQSEKLVKKILKTDPLCLIDYWSVDFDFDGKVHRPERIFFSNKDKEYECEKIGSTFGNISIHIADVFGNNTFILGDKRCEKIY
jgi:hypothetical protein